MVNRRKLSGLTLLALAVSGLLVGSYKIGNPPGPRATQQLQVTTVPPGALQVQFFGTTTLLLRDGRNAVMFDAFLSRPGLYKVLTRGIASDGARVKDSLARAHVDRIDLLFISHSHFDHVFDAPIVAKRTGAFVVGSPSTYEVGLGGGLLPGQMRKVRGSETIDAGNFKVAVLRSLHSRGDKVPGEIDQPLLQPASIKSYREGGTFSYVVEHSGLRMIIHPSANYIPGMYRNIHADIVFLSIGGLGAQPPDFTEAYWREVVEASGAKLVIPIHWDDFTQPLDKPLQPFRRFMDDVPTAMRNIDSLARKDGVNIRYLPVFEPIDIQASVSR